MLSIMESKWLRRFFKEKDPKGCFPSGKQMSQELIPGMLPRTMQCFMFPALVVCATISIPSHLWTSRTWFDTFTMVVIFVDDEWHVQHVTMGLFKALDTS